MIHIFIATVLSEAVKYELRIVVSVRTLWLWRSEVKRLITNSAAGVADSQYYIMSSLRAHVVVRAHFISLFSLFSNDLTVTFAYDWHCSYIHYDDVISNRNHNRNLFPSTCTT